MDITTTSITRITSYETCLLLLADAWSCCELMCWQMPAAPPPAYPCILGYQPTSKRLPPFNKLSMLAVL